MQNSGALPLYSCDSSFRSSFRWRAAVPRRKCIAAAISAPPERARQQQRAAKSISVEQDAVQKNAQPTSVPNPVLSYFSSAISGISALWMQQGSKVSNVQLLEETAQRAAEVTVLSKLRSSFAHLLEHSSWSRWLAVWVIGRLTLPCWISEHDFRLILDQNML